MTVAKQDDSKSNEPAQVEPEAAEKKEKVRTRRTKASSPGLLNQLITLVLIAAIGGISYYFYMLQQKQDKKLIQQQQAIALLQSSLEQARNELSSNKSALGSQQQQLQQLVEKSSQAEMVSQQAMEMISRNQRDWAIAEIDYLLRIAHQRVEIARDIKGAIAALRGADSRIVELGDLKLMKIRKQLAEDIGQLNAIHQADVNGISLAIDQMVANLTELPFKSAVEEIKKQLKDDSAGVVTNQQDENFLDSVMQTVKQIGDIKIHSRSIETASTSEQQQQIEQLLRTHLLSARLAALRHDQLQFQYDVEQSMQLLSAHYDAGDNRVLQMQNDLKAYQALQLSPDLPELTRAWTLLQQEISKENNIEIKESVESQEVNQ